MESLQSQGVTVTEHPYLDYALNLSDYNYLKALDAFLEWLDPGAGCQLHAGF